MVFPISTDAISSALKVPFRASPVTNTPFSEQKDIFFAPFKIDKNRWNQVFQYRLLVIDSKTNKVIEKGEGKSTASDYTYFVNGNDYSITESLTSNVWELPLPITPQQLSIQDVFAISNTPTLRGIIEEHNGVKYKNIQMAGTFGIYTNRNAEKSTLQSNSVFQSLFAGTLEAVGNVQSTLNKLQNIGGHPSAISKGHNTPTDLNTTGYYYAMYAGQFLEQYALAKKDPNNSHWRLVLDMPKRGESFVVTPVSYTSSQSINKPAEYMFQMQLKAWKRVDLKAEPLGELSLPTKISLNTLQKINSGLRDLRTLIAQSTNVLKAIRADYQAVLNTIRQTTLLIKDTAGFIQTAIDLGPGLIADTKSTWSQMGKDLEIRFQMPNGSAASGGKAVTQTAKAALTVGFIKSLSASHEGTIPQTNGAAATTNTNGTPVVDNEGPGDNGVDSVYKNPEANFKFLDTLPVSQARLTQAQQNIINDEMALIRLTTTNDLKNTKALLQSVAFDLSNHFGAGDPTVAAIYGRPVPTTRSTPMTIEENELIQAFYEVISSLDTLTSSKQFDTQQQLRQTSLQLVGGLASNVNILIDSYNSKYQAPVPYGLSIEQIAMRYLKSADKWIEIVTINALREPYIDEVGFSYPLLSNADGRSFTVNDSQLRLFIGQKITLSDTNTLPYVRVISDINKISDTSYLITVDGNADLTLATNANANLKAYLPGTVNSQNIIYIPSNLPSDPTSDLFPIPNLSPDKLNDLANVDFLLDDSGDIAINSVGDFRLSNGLTNLIQTLKLKIQTKKGSLLRHSDYGLGITAGMSTADINSGEMIKSLNEMIKNDPRFESISSIQITLKENTLNINMVVNLANRTGVLPINFDTKI